MAALITRTSSCLTREDHCTRSVFRSRTALLSKLPSNQGPLLGVPFGQPTVVPKMPMQQGWNPGAPMQQGPKLDSPIQQVPNLEMLIAQLRKLHEPIGNGPSLLEP